MQGGSKVFIQGRLEVGPYWCGVCFHGMGWIHLNTSLTSDHYVSLLGDHLQPFKDFMCPQNDGIFQKYNAPSCPELV